MLFKQYKWRGVHATGNSMTGCYDASSKRELLKFLHDSNVTLTNYRIKININYKKKLNREQLFNFCNELTNLLKAQMPLLNALKLIADNDKLAHDKQFFATIITCITNGKMLSASLALFPHYFSKIDIALLKAGEATGNLIYYLEQITQKQALARTIKKQLRQAVSYPIFILIFALLISYGMLQGIVPKFQNLFANMGGRLPAITQIMIQLSNLVQQHALEAFSFLATPVIVISLALKKSPTCRRYILQGFLTIKPIKKITLFYQYFAWSNVMSLLLDAQVPLLNALTISTQSLQIMQLHKAFSEVITQTELGISLDKSFIRAQLFDDTWQQLTRLAIQSGNLSRLFKEMADHYHNQFQHHLHIIKKMLEPLTMLLVAILVGAMVLALYLPVFQMGSML